MSRPWFNRYSSKSNNKKYTGNNPSNVLNLENYGYTGFRLYFPDDSDLKIDILNKHVTIFKKFFEQNQAFYSVEDIATNKFCMLDFQLISENDEITSQWPDFKSELVNNSEYCLKCMGLAMHDLISKHDDQNEENTLQLDVLIVRICNVEPIMQLSDLRVNYFGKLVTIRGTVIKAGHVKLISKYSTFSCGNCSGSQVLQQPDGVYTPPTKCQTSDCRARSNFNVVHDSSFNRVISWQLIKIQEMLWIDEQENARTPCTLDCELTEDLVKTCLPGDDVTITGVIKVRDSNSNNNRNKQHSIFNLYLEAVSVFNNKKQGKGNSSIDGITFNQNDYFEIKKIHCASNVFGLLVNSLCPNIFGHDIVKAGLLLSLFGGSKSDTFRAESHVLMVGDPGLGKSQLLQSCASVAPRGIYVCGNTSTSSGLTVTMVRDGGEYSLEAGALMLSDQGCCCIDEFDKMPSQHACLLEAMEQQSISIAKAGIVCVLPTRASILAAANPAGGHYNKAKTVAENLKMSSPMLSRFDLIFILLDKANEEVDLLLSKHVLGMHSENSQKSKLFDTSSLIQDSSLDQTLRDRLRLDSSQIDLIPHSLFRKYIAYAQKYVKPTLSEEARELLKQFYLTLRKQFQIGDCTPVTTRQANSLIRLTQARAKAELREVATKQDAEDVIEIMKMSLKDIFTDESGVLDKTRSQNGTGTSTKSQITRLLKLLQRVSEIETKSIFTTKELKQLSEQAGIAQDKFFTVIQNINLQGFLLNKGLGKYQLITADV